MTNYVGYYGSDGRFRLLRTTGPSGDARLVSRGKIAITFRRDELVQIAAELGLGVSPVEQRAAIVNLIERHIPIIENPWPHADQSYYH